MANDPILHLLGLAKKAGRLEIGEEPVGAVCRAKQARLLLLAGDAAPNTCRRAAHFGEAGNVLWLQLPCTKEELGWQLGRTSCAMVAVTDFGLAAAITDKLYELDPERYGPAAMQTREKADRALQRQQEKRQHEKNLQRGMKKPWAPPPVEPGRPPEPDRFPMDPERPPVEPPRPPRRSPEPPIEPPRPARRPPEEPKRPARGPAGPGREPARGPSGPSRGPGAAAKGQTAAGSKKTGSAGGPGGKKLTARPTGGKSQNRPPKPAK
jgi:ribosomal protein L7Ae-like RNA K-turn-binding protein